MAAVARARARVEEVCAALPGAIAEAQGAHVGFRVRGRRFAWFLDDHHGDGRVAEQARAAPGAAADLVAADPQRLFRAPR